jgi:hypothetical protein
MNEPPKPPEHDAHDAEPVAGDGVTQEAIDAAEQELETPEDTTNEG